MLNSANGTARFDHLAARIEWNSINSLFDRGNRHAFLITRTGRVEFELNSDGAATSGSTAATLAAKARRRGDSPDRQ